MAKPLIGKSGYSLIELLVTIGVMAIAAAIAVPNLMGYLPKYRLRTAVDDLYTEMQAAKMAAIDQNGESTIEYQRNPDQYVVTYPNGTNRTIRLDNYGSGVTFRGPTNETVPDDPTLFTARGTSRPGYAYLTNSGRTSYFRVGPLISGIIRLQRYDGVSKWE